MLALKKQACCELPMERNMWQGVWVASSTREPQTYNHKELNSSNSHVKIEDDPEFQQPRQHLDCSM